MIAATADEMVKTPLYWLPSSTQPVRNQFGRADGVEALLKRLADEEADGVVTVLSHPHVMQLVLMRGLLVDALCSSGTKEPPAQGEAALRAWSDRNEADAGARSQISSLDRSVAECLSASLDPNPDVTPLVSIDQLREALRHLATVGHHGVVDVTSDGLWGRVLFHHGRVLGAFDSENPTVVGSLAGIGRLVNGDDVLMIARVAPGTLTHISWPVGPSALASDALTPAPAPAETELDERIESELMWLLCDVDRDRERASRGSASDAQLMQVLASFANATFSMAGELAASASPPQAAPNLSRALAELGSQHPTLSEVRLKGGSIDASALAKRCKSMSMDGEDGMTRIDFFANTCRGLLELARQGAGGVTEHMSSPAVALRCATALEACMISIELELPSRRFRVPE